MKRTSILLSVVAVIFLLSAYAEANGGYLGDGICSKEEKDLGKCFVSLSQFVVEILPNEAGKWPIPVTCPGESGGTCYKFRYRVTPPECPSESQTLTLKYVDELIPYCNISILAQSPQCPPETTCLFTNGIGDTQTGFGVGDLDNDVLKLPNINLPCHHCVAPKPYKDFSFITKGAKVGSTKMLLKFSNPAKAETDNILGPACPSAIPSSSYSETTSGASLIGVETDPVTNKIVQVTIDGETQYVPISDIKVQFLGELHDVKTAGPNCVIEISSPACYKQYWLGNKVYYKECATCPCP